MTFDIGEQHREVCAGPPEPARQALADHRTFRPGLDQIEECAIGAADDAFGIDDDESIGQALDQVVDRNRILFDCIRLSGPAGRQVAASSPNPDSGDISEARTSHGLRSLPRWIRIPGALPWPRTRIGHRLEEFAILRGNARNEIALADRLGFQLQHSERCAARPDWPG